MSLLSPKASFIITYASLYSKIILIIILSKIYPSQLLTYCKSTFFAPNFIFKTFEALLHIKKYLIFVSTYITFLPTKFTMFGYFSIVKQTVFDIFFRKLILILFYLLYKRLSLILISFSIFFFFATKKIFDLVTFLL